MYKKTYKINFLKESNYVYVEEFFFYEIKLNNKRDNNLINNEL